jgi:NAD(P)-dependent dehydrogenase (short-subunit alcohol dehydrogenase family)
MEINGKRALVVGGASGMGQATAELLTRRGATVTIIDRSEALAQEVARAIGANALAADILDHEATRIAIDAAVETMGSLHICVTTAGGGTTPDGVWGRRTLTRTGPHDIDAFQYVVDLNAVGTFNVSRLAAEWMSHNEPEDDERGVIVNTASIAAFEGQVGQVAYTAGKAAIAAMSLTMARDLGNLGIRVLAIAPSLFLTGIAREHMTAEMERDLLRDAVFPKRPGRPEEYARLVQAIVEIPMLNGQCIRLDAATRMAPK